MLLGRWRTHALAGIAVLIAVVPSACSDGEDQVRETVELYLAKHEPRGCKVMTDRYLRNRHGEPNRGAALRECRKQESGDNSEEQLPGIEAPDRWTVSTVEVDGDDARAGVVPHGGTYDGKEVSLALVKQDGDWKVDGSDGFEVDDELRRTFERRVRMEISRTSQLPGHVIDCIVEGVHEAFPNKRLADVVEGKVAPETTDRDLDAVGRECDLTRAASVFEGTGFRVSLPPGWQDATEQARAQGFVQAHAFLTGERTRSFTVNVNVVRESVPPGQSLGEAVAASRRFNSNPKLLRKHGIPGDPSNVGPPTRTSLDGESAMTYGLLNRFGGNRLRQRQLSAIRDGTLYTVTFSALRDRFDEQHRQYEAILDSWRWTRSGPGAEER